MFKITVIYEDLYGERQETRSSAKTEDKATKWASAVMKEGLIVMDEKPWVCIPPHKILAIHIWEETNE